MIDRSEPLPHIFPASRAPDSPACALDAEHQHRLLANALRIWLLCEQTSCRRAWRCCGAALSCVPRLIRQVPAGARRDFSKYLGLRRMGISSEVAGLMRVEDKADVEAWCSALPRRRRRPASRESRYNARPRSERGTP